jgi:hypothetical protein
VNPKLEHLAANTLGAPEPILSDHALNELDDIGRDARRWRLRRPTLPAPEQAKALAVPAKHRLGLHEQQRVAPPRQHRREHGDQAALMWLESWSLHLPCRNDKLLAQKNILRGQFGSRTQQVSQETTDDRARSWTKRFSHRPRRTGEDRLQFGEDTSGHETDLRRD